MKITLECEPNEIAVLLQVIKNITSPSSPIEQSPIPTTHEVRYVVDIQTINELSELARTKRKDETP